MKSYSIRKIGAHRGAPRLWMEGKGIERAGFLPGTRYSIEKHPSRPLLTLRQAEDGVRVVSRHLRNERELPVIDINSQELLDVFTGLEAVRVVVQEGVISILPVASELRAQRRLCRLRDRIDGNQVIQIGSASSGVGILDYAAHAGLAEAGVSSHLAFANEIREDCMEHALLHNPTYDENTLTLTAPMQEVVFDEWAMRQVPEVDLLVAGIPCSGASVAGRTKRGLDHPESHPDVGHLAVAFLALIARVNPAVVVLENVPPYRSSASMSIIRTQLRDLGYEVHETELDASEWNMLEHRRRMCMVAVTKGMTFSFDELERPAKRAVSFGEVMDAVPADASTWGNIDYLFAKKERDQAAGKGFSPTIVDEHSPKVPTLNKTLSKRQSTGTFIAHPSEPGLYRIPTVAEHARCKGVPESLVADVTQTFGHETLGQSISVAPFVSVFRLIGNALKRMTLQGEDAAPFFRMAVAA